MLRSPHTSQGMKTTGRTSVPLVWGLTDYHLEVLFKTSHINTYHKPWNTLQSFGPPIGQNVPREKDRSGICYHRNLGINQLLNIITLEVKGQHPWSNIVLILHKCPGNCVKFSNTLHML